jgi:hypothetical protein
MQENGQWWRLLSSPFITAGAIQVSANISGLWTYGLFLASYLNAWKLGECFVWPTQSSTSTRKWELSVAALGYDMLGKEDAASGSSTQLTSLPVQ